MLTLICCSWVRSTGLAGALKGGGGSTRKGVSTRPNLWKTTQNAFIDHASQVGQVDGRSRFHVMYVLCSSTKQHYNVPENYATDRFWTTYDSDTEDVCNPFHKLASAQTKMFCRRALDVSDFTVDGRTSFPDARDLHPGSRRRRHRLVHLEGHSRRFRRPFGECRSRRGRRTRVRPRLVRGPAFDADGY